MIVTEKGNIYPGYLPAKQWLEALESENNPQVIYQKDSSKKPFASCEPFDHFYPVTPSP